VRDTSANGPRNISQVVVHLDDETQDVEGEALFRVAWNPSRHKRPQRRHLHHQLVYSRTLTFMRRTTHAAIAAAGPKIGTIFRRITLLLIGPSHLIRFEW
jgi:hypothetical protein